MQAVVSGLRQCEINLHSLPIFYIWTISKVDFLFYFNVLGFLKLLELQKVQEYTGQEGNHSVGKKLCYH
jgi:hypothetical protein